MTSSPSTAAAERTGGAARRYSISQLAAEFGLTPRTIRFYEDEKLLAPKRVGLNRVYSHRDRARLILICRGKRLGFSLAEIKEFLDLYDVDSARVGQASYALKRAHERIAALEAQQRDLEQTLAELRQMAADMAGHLRRQGIDPETI